MNGYVTTADMMSKMHLSRHTVSRRFKELKMRFYKDGYNFALRLLIIFFTRVSNDVNILVIAKKKNEFDNVENSIE